MKHKTEIVPVIHMVDLVQVKTNIETCLSFDINKVFLINHGHGIEAVTSLLNVIHSVKQKYPDLWIGANFLQANNDESVKYGSLYKLDGIWCDNGNLSRVGNVDEAWKTRTILNEQENRLQYFGGVEFKYQKQPHVSELDWIYERAVDLIDVITTSGEGTGQEIDMGKLTRIRKSINNHPLAVASGIDKNNVKNISELANYLMVSSSITNPKNELIIPNELEILINNLN